MAWTTVEEVAVYLGVRTDAPSLPELVEVSTAYCSRLRRDLTEETLPADARLACTMYAAHLYRIKSNPAGSAVFDDLGADAGSQDSLLSEVWRLLGARKPSYR